MHRQAQRNGVPKIELIEGRGARALESGLRAVAALHSPATGLDYRVDAQRAAAFERDARRYWPGLPTGALQPAYSGVRPKIVGPDAPAGDFVLSGPNAHGVAAWVALYGIESPGLTACLAVADAVVREIAVAA